MLESARLGYGGYLEGLSFVIGLAGCNHDVDDPCEFVSCCSDAFGFAQAAFHAATVIAHFASGATEGVCGQAQDVGDSVDDLARARFEHATAGNPVVGT